DPVNASEPVRAPHGESATGLASKRVPSADRNPCYPRLLRHDAVEKAAAGVTKAFPIDRLGEMLGETGGFGGGDVAVGSESAERDSIYLTGVTQLVHQIQATAIG